MAQKIVEGMIVFVVTNFAISFRISFLKYQLLFQRFNKKNSKAYIIFRKSFSSIVWY